ncbi:hypothetical protein HMPREF1487_04887 [Pseudomonas sp. HPB0071]|uniref:Uncharacterized protein n=1 Tax=Pseudomonas luteola TaxID=47886 RepID=A0A2X2CN50_PSELU|nr:MULTISPECIES: hypothetical protein [Pseudomonas]ENA36713.1 hypothetical protein HMPREF1487_04887 [Pseudomonas sp. HPB0071]MBF8640055.1 hypothetical protein [Pseudomonas zeshuii]RRW40448.1 hypothetical protein EGJ50_24475 [Pseudomonas luteola]SHI34165.1 hypothetical protein SAMN05216295_101292 [Pseudomonas zeshuii]SPZ08684.1 Uncharacterised protein [Pseudomonas luteola]
MRKIISFVFAASIMPAVCLAQGLELDQDVGDLNILAESSSQELPNDAPQTITLTNNEKTPVKCWLQAHGPKDSEQEEPVIVPGKSATLRMPGKSAETPTKAKLVCRKQ